MNESELKTLWQSVDAKVKNIGLINEQQLNDISQIKVHGLLHSMKPVKLFALLVGILWVGAGSYLISQIYIHAFAEANKFFLFSASIQLILTAIAVLTYLYQLSKIYGVEITDPILQTQGRLAQLKTSTLLSARILILQLPLWTIFYWNESMLQNGSLILWVIQGIVTLSFTVVAVWLFFQIKYENRNTKWFKLIFNGKEWAPLMKSIDLLEQVEEYKDTSSK